MKIVKQVLAIFLLAFISLSASSAELVSLKTRPGVEQKFILIKHKAPQASVILFAGGKGALNLTSMLGKPTVGWGKKNFLVRSRKVFAKNGLQVAVVDAPSDRQFERGLRDGFRNSPEHVADIDHVIMYLREQANVPVWLVGTSRGTESATHIAINSKQKPDGLVLTSSMSVPNGTGTAVTEMDLKPVKMPVLIVAHSDDKCEVTPPQGAADIAEKLMQAEKVEVKLFSGGKRPTSKPCKAMSKHGFIGIEKQVVNYISDFIKSN